MKRFNSTTVLVLALALVASLLGVMSWNTPLAVQGAPMAVPTPITQQAYNAAPRHADFWATATALTADTRSSCVNVSGYNTIDLHYIVDQGTVNTTTLTMEFSVIDDNYPDGIAVLSANAADAEDIKQYNVFGEQMCLYADVTNSNAWTVTVQGLLK